VTHSARPVSNDPSLPEGFGPILLVDDDSDARSPLARSLARAGYPVRQAETGEAALEIARKERPTLVVLEVCLSDVSGYTVCRELRERFGEELPIIFVSAKRTESFDRVAGLLVGADEYLAKPLATDEVVARVRRLVRRPPAVAPPVASKLTARELEVLRLLAEGLAPKEIATQLFLSPKTVGTHIENIFRKLGVRTRAQAVAVAYRDALVASPR
jgi:DNA-binding NarL/FixJ family response regulator